MDAVPIAAPPAAPPASRRMPRATLFKLLLALFALYLLVASDTFIDGVLSSWPDAVAGRAPTAWGVVLQGIFLVAFYALAFHYIEDA